MKMNVSRWIAVLLLFFVLLPFAWWQLQAKKPLSVMLIDKTVPTTSYREHKGLTWLFNYEKYVKDNDQFYTPKKDYEGIKPMGSSFQEDDIVGGLKKKRDLIYLADTYGVYQADLPHTKHDGRKSEQLYGGLTAEEADAISNHLFEKGGTFISEFNSFASPTKPEVREQMYDLLNLKWSGWTGRYFKDLSNDEVPVWMRENYEKQTKKKWTFAGVGIVLVNAEERLVVIPEGHLKGDLLFSFTKEGDKQLGLSSTSKYRYWFDIVSPLDKNEVLANYQLQVDDETKRLLKNEGVPLTFPAVVHHQTKRFQTYYFAGDYADNEEIPSFYQAKGIPLLEKVLSYVRKKDSNFYWQTYIPMTQRILKDLPYKTEKSSVQTTKVKDVTMNGRVGKSYLQIYKDGKWQDLLIKGINLGLGKPGHYPGEVAITKAEYMRWFKQMGAMHANTLRIYTLHPPSFYQALAEYNTTAKDPLYLFQGVWVDEEPFKESHNAFKREVSDVFDTEIKRMVDVVHGNAKVTPVKGHASGTYRADVSKYLLGWIIGIEWDPDVVVDTDKANKGLSDFNGKYVYTRQASPFEHWIARHLNTLAVYEDTKYKWQRPISFVDWPTTDLLKHPFEPSDKEDKVTVDPNHIYTNKSFYAGMFASYHFYPYYPDFLNFEPKYLKYKDKDGKKNNYAGYLNDMKAAHRMPIVVAEFGVPGSRGMTHRNVYGMNQGFLSEQEQGTINTNLFKDIVNEKMAGGMVFTWQDEWFKRTWNTMEYDNKDRRPYWSNLQTNEQHFGLLSFDPGLESQTIYVDGNDLDWEKRKDKTIYTVTQPDSPLKKVTMASDEAYLYLKMDYKEPVDPKHINTYVAFDTFGNQGQSTLPKVPSFKTTASIDFLMDLKDSSTSRMLVDSYYDTFYFQYGHQLQMIDEVPYASKKNNGTYHPMRLVLNRELEFKGRKTVPFEDYETGKLKIGNGNPSAKNYNSLTDFAVKGTVVEARIPWQLLNVKDPSTHEIMGDMWKVKDMYKALEAKSTTKSINFGIVNYDQKGNLTSSTINKQGQMWKYDWKQWEEPFYHERLKKSYDIMKKAYSNIGFPTK